MNGIVASKNDKWDDFNSEILNNLFHNGDIPRSPSYGVYILQLIRLMSIFSNIYDFNSNKHLDF